MKVPAESADVYTELPNPGADIIFYAGLHSQGRGVVLGTFAGALLMQTIASGCTQLGLRNPIQHVILGVIIAAAVTADRIRQRRAALPFPHNRPRDRHPRTSSLAYPRIFFKACTNLPAICHSYRQEIETFSR